MAMNSDADQLKLLSIFHYVVGGLAGLFALIPTLYLGLGLCLIFASCSSSDGDASPVVMGLFFVVFGLVAIVLGLILAIAIICSGRFLSQRKHYTFCLVMAGVECIFMPFGTVLGAFTLVVLLRESVKQLFTGNPPPPPAAPPPPAPAVTP
jgi:hypothetical protein